MSEKKWEIVTNEDIEKTERLKVEGGYLYRATNYDENAPLAMCFVPDVDLQRYQSHLRDAYTQGVKDGKEEIAKFIQEVKTHADNGHKELDAGWILAQFEGDNRFNYEPGSNLDPNFVTDPNIHIIK